MKFYDYKHAPSPRRVRIFIHEKGIDIPVEEVDLRNQAQFNDDFLKKNPQGTVPVLELDDGTYLSDTLAICSYLESLFPQPSLMGEDAKQRARVLMWYMRVVDEGFQAVGESFRNFVKAFRKNALTGIEGYDQIPELVDRGRRRSSRFLDMLDEHLAGRAYIVDETFSLADIAALVTVDFARVIKLEVGDEQPHLMRWYDDVSSRPSARL